MKTLITIILCLPLCLFAQVPPPAPATSADVTAGTATYKFISPKALSDAGLVSYPTNGVTAATATNIAAYQALIATNGLGSGSVTAAGLAAGSYTDGSTTGASHTNNVNWNTSVFVSASRGNDTTGKRANPLLPFASIAAANAAAISYDTVIVTDGNFIEQIVPRQNIAFYLSYGTTVSNASSVTINVPVSVTNLTILGRGTLHNYATLVISSTSTNILSVTIDAEAIYGAVSGIFRSVTIRANTFYGNISRVNSAGSSFEVSLSPLTQPTAAVTFDNAGVYPFVCRLDNCATTNTASIADTGTRYHYGGTLSDYYDSHSANFIFNNTKIINWLYEDDPGFYGATVQGNYFKE